MGFYTGKGWAILLRLAGVGKVGKVKGIMQEWILNFGDLKYVQIHDLDDSFNNSRVHCSYDLRLQIKQRGSFF